MVTPTFRRKQPHLPALVAGLCLAAVPGRAAADDLANRAFQLKYDGSGITSLNRTADVADTDYIAATARWAADRALSHERARDGRSCAICWPAGQRHRNGSYVLGTRRPAMASRASGRRRAGSPEFAAWTASCPGLPRPEEGEEDQAPPDRRPISPSSRGRRRVARSSGSNTRFPAKKRSAGLKSSGRWRRNRGACCIRTAGNGKKSPSPARTAVRRTRSRRWRSHPSRRWPCGSK